MDNTNIKKALKSLCDRNPEIRKKLARALREATIHDDYMSWQALLKMKDRVPQILERLTETGDDLEDWQETKIQLAAEYLDAVYDSLMYSPEEHDAEEG